MVDVIPCLYPCCDGCDAIEHVKDYCRLAPWVESDEGACQAWQRALAAHNKTLEARLDPFQWRVAREVGAILSPNGDLSLLLYLLCLDYRERQGRERED